MSQVTIFHNPRCSKSRQTLQLLQDNGIDPEVVEYLKAPPTAAELKSVLEKLGMRPEQILRNKEAEYKELNLKEFNGTDGELIEIIVQHPKLLERPIVINGPQARVGRPPENVLEII